MCAQPLKVRGHRRVIVRALMEALIVGTERRMVIAQTQVVSAKLIAEAFSR